MSEVPSRSMLVDEFLAWAHGRPGRFELVNGRVLAVAPERVRHTMIKGEVFASLRGAIRDAGKPCQAFCDGVTVRIDASTPTNRMRRFDAASRSTGTASRCRTR